MEQKITEQQRIMRKPEIRYITGLSDITVWRMERDGKFPKRVRLGGNSCGWLAGEVNTWLAQRVEARG